MRRVPELADACAARRARDRSRRRSAGSAVTRRAPVRGRAEQRNARCRAARWGCRAARSTARCCGAPSGRCGARARRHGSGDRRRRSVQTRDGAAIAAPALFLAAGKHGFRGFAREPAAWQRRRSGDGAARAAARASGARPAGRRRGRAAPVRPRLCRAGAAGGRQRRTSASRSTSRGSTKRAAIRRRCSRALGDAMPQLGERLALCRRVAPSRCDRPCPLWLAHAPTPRPALFRLGDQAGVIPCLAGEGMGIALASAECGGGGMASRRRRRRTGFQRALAARWRGPSRSPIWSGACGENPAARAVTRRRHFFRLLVRMLRDDADRGADPARLAATRHRPILTHATAPEIEPMDRDQSPYRIRMAQAPLDPSNTTCCARRHRARLHRRIYRQQGRRRLSLRRLRRAAVRQRHQVRHRDRAGRASPRPRRRTAVTEHDRRQPRHASAPKCAAPTATAISAMSSPTARRRRGCAIASTARRSTSRTARRMRRQPARLNTRSRADASGAQRGNGTRLCAATRQQASSGQIVIIPQAPRHVRRRAAALARLACGAIVRWGLGLAVVGARRAGDRGRYRGAALPSFDELKNSPNGQMIRVHAADGTVIVSLGPSYGEWLTLREIPQVMQDAMVAVEDRRFRIASGRRPDRHGARGQVAVQNRGSGRRLQGASTITQQLARNIFLSNSMHVRPQGARGDPRARARMEILEGRRSSNSISTRSISAAAPMASTPRRAASSAIARPS